jgi:heme-degrading monooxygenase HmoA
MYVTRQEYQIQGLRLAEFEERTNRLGEVLQGCNGYQGRRLLRSAGHPNRYTILGLWDSFDDAEAAVRGPVRAYVDKNPQPEWIVPVRPVEAYEQVHEIASGGAQGVIPGHVILVDWTLSRGPGSGPAFEASRKEIFTLHQQQSEGFLRHRLLRFLGSSDRYLVLNAWTSIDAARAAFQSAQAQALAQKHAASEFTAIQPSGHIYTPVRVAVPA